ncbi:cobalt-precorrin-6A reductase [Robbsia sp. Bb-Pol-6]|uniref:Cobalt-precorrin-6A reductase n=1 Tax=Robbsia betulipollinis TaxID=2981849 RepID=A0ABT3ZGR6_9BURK|nr:cobalt-precorrin-6A reductase [Robbsia betulipollinis]MCY0385719.1 cobalt-precorrin-6A reductase [Robbsia betulipollinis]
MARRLLLLGGTGEGLAIARQLGAGDIYSIAGLGVTPVALPCAVRVGGFGGADGLARFVLAQGVTTLVDATHPYAARISANALAAAHATGIPCWTLRRPPWRCAPGDDWREVEDWDGIVAALVPFRRPLFTLGRAPLAHLHAIPAHQHWVVRCLDPAAAAPGVVQTTDHSGRATLVAARGPFAIDDERAFFTDARIDVIVSKLSGGAATQAKLDVARERGLPVVMLARPGRLVGALPDAAPADDPQPARVFASAAEVLRALADPSWNTA